MSLQLMRKHHQSTKRLYQLFDQLLRMLEVWQLQQQRNIFR